MLYGRTLLHLAAAMGQVKLVECLVQHGASVGTRDYFGKTAYDVAQQYDQREVVKVLEPYAASILPDDRQSWTYMLGGISQGIFPSQRAESSVLPSPTPMPSGDLTCSDDVLDELTAFVNDGDISRISNR
ncbi:hypothetical protein BJX99DRAFT_236501 [Aspergillus californicus]